MSYLTFPTVDSTTGKNLPGPSSYRPTRNFKLKESKFGDRYTQATPDGINYKYTEWDLSWDTLWDTEKNTFKSFIEARGGYQTFLWLCPEDNATYKVKCRKVNWEWDKKAGVWNMSMTFEEVPQ